MPMLFSLLALLAVLVATSPVPADLIDGIPGTLVALAAEKPLIGVEFPMRRALSHDNNEAGGNEDSDGDSPDLDTHNSVGDESSSSESGSNNDNDIDTHNDSDNEPDHSMDDDSSSQDSSGNQSDNDNTIDSHGEDDTGSANDGDAGNNDDGSQQGDSSQDNSAEDQGKKPAGMFGTISNSCA